MPRHYHSFGYCLVVGLFTIALVTFGITAIVDFILWIGA